ncbi:MAG: 7-carboxy-7-deazaguanine synthase [Deltaproteobacteria bacterium]|nr:MAG: 7-carboxy-7-deazaguanine synthase [Deltaproteobacteria bacterium]
MSLRVNEIFYSIQGESSHAGSPCVFIRLTGCNLRCDYCDTRYAYEEGDLLDISEVLRQVDYYACPLVEITGGEPLLQEDTADLIQNLLEKNYTVLLETNGTLDLAEIDRRCVKIIDIKCPSSGEHEKRHPDIFTWVRAMDEIKFVIGDRADYDYARRILAYMRGELHLRNTVLFSPVFGQTSPDTLVEWILEDHLDVRLNLQLHKMIWGANQQGV